MMRPHRKGYSMEGLMNPTKFEEQTDQSLGVDELRCIVTSTVGKC